MKFNWKYIEMNLTTTINKSENGKEKDMKLQYKYKFKQQLFRV